MQTSLKWSVEGCQKAADSSGWSMTYLTWWTVKGQTLAWIQMILLRPSKQPLGTNPGLSFTRLWRVNVYCMWMYLNYLIAWLFLILYRGVKGKKSWKILSWHWGKASFKAHPPSSGGRLMSVCLMSLLRDILLQVQTHSSSRVKGWARKWWVDYSRPGRSGVCRMKPGLFGGWTALCTHNGVTNIHSWAEHDNMLFMHTH